MTNSRVSVAVVCPCFNEIRYLPEFVNSLLGQSIFKDNRYRVTVLFVDGNSTDGSQKFLHELCESHPDFELVNNPERFVSNGLNKAVSRAKALNVNYLVRLDLHAVYPGTYIFSLVEGIRSLERRGVRVGNFGGLVNTLPGAVNAKACIIAAAMSSSFGVGGSLFRVGSSGIRSVDTVPFGCFPIHVFDEIGMFDEDLIRNQDDEFNGRLKKFGWEVYLDSSIVVDYFARGDFRKLYSMFLQYGYFKPMVNRKLGKPTTARQFAPPAFVMTLFVFVALSAWSILPFLAILIAYMAYAFIFCLYNPISIPSRFLIRCIYAFQTLFIMHFSYGVGYLVGATRLPYRYISKSIRSSR